LLNFFAEPENVKDLTNFMQRRSLWKETKNPGGLLGERYVGEYVDIWMGWARWTDKRIH
jgi:hypothetical protein